MVHNTTLIGKSVRFRESAALDIIGIAGALALAAQLKIYTPLSPVPFTLQTFVVLLAPFAVGAPRATAGILLYIILGIAGAPLFAAGAGIGASFGYILAWAMVPALIGRFDRPMPALFAATGLIYAVGLAWLCLFTGMDPMRGVAVGVAPFLVFDLLKIGLAYKAIPYVLRQP